jgi:hypothetical protein
MARTNIAVPKGFGHRLRRERRPVVAETPLEVQVMLLIPTCGVFGGDSPSKSTPAAAE